MSDYILEVKGLTKNFKNQIAVNNVSLSVRKNSVYCFLFNSLEIAKLYVRTADYTMKKSCGVYEISNSKGRVSY